MLKNKKEALRRDNGKTKKWQTASTEFYVSPCLFAWAAMPTY